MYRTFDSPLLLACPCCAALTLSTRGHFEICSACDWEDDPIQFADPDFAGGANIASLRDARASVLRTWHGFAGHAPVRHA